MKRVEDTIFNGTKAELLELIKAGRPGVDPAAGYESLSDPYLLQDMDKAVDRIEQAVKAGEKIAIYGDYDIDGLTATTLLSEFLKMVGAGEIYCHIPNRFTDGYGLVKSSLKMLKEQGCSLVITVDCGSLSIKEAEYAKEIGLDLIITDHHTINPQVPDCVAVVNPKRHANAALDPPVKPEDDARVGSRAVFTELAGVGVAFKLARAIQMRMGLPEAGQEKWLLDLVALGTVCDVVPLVSENYILAKYGLAVLKKTRRPGLKHLARVSAVDLSRVTADDLGYRFGPRLNASGRLEDARISLDLLQSDHAETAARMAFELDVRNAERKAAQDKIYREACRLADLDDNPVLIIKGVDWSHGVVGIVASKLMERYSKPCFVLEDMGEESKGSGRSFGDYHLANAIKFASEHVKKGGGHALAAGVTLATSEFDNFRQKLYEFYQQTVESDQKHFRQKPVAAIVGHWRHFDLDFIHELDNLGPFGMGNRRPVFGIPEAVVREIKTLGSDGKHLKLTLADHAKETTSCIAFNFADQLKHLKSGDKVNLAKFEVQENIFNGRSSAQLCLVEVE